MKFKIGDYVEVKCGTGIFGRQLYCLGTILLLSHHKVMCNLGNEYGTCWVKKKDIEGLHETTNN